MKSFNLALVLATLIATSFSEDCKCTKGDVPCTAKCLGLPNPSPELAALTLECNTSCTAEASDFDECFQTCVKDVYLKFTDITNSSTKTAESKTTEKTSESESTEKTTKSKSETKTTTISDKTTTTETTTADKSKATDTSAKETLSETKKSSSFSRSAINDSESSANGSQLALYSSVVVLASTVLYYIL